MGENDGGRTQGRKRWGENSGDTWTSATYAQHFGKIITGFIEHREEMQIAAKSKAYVPFSLPFFFIFEFSLFCQ